MNVLAEAFKAYDIRGKVGRQLTVDIVRDIGRAFADWLPSEGIIAVGRDMRPDSDELAKAFIEGLIQQGRAVWDIGLITSDMSYFAVGKYSLAGSAVITASHNPGTDNGIKLYRDNVIPVGLDAGLDQIRDTVLTKQFKSSPKTGHVQQKDIAQDWITHCLGFVDNLPGFHIAIDAGNGMAGSILPKVLSKLPLSVERMYFELDGSFPNHEANPHNPENLADLIKVVLDKKLDFGIAFDGDGDRAALVDDRGRPVLGSDLLSLVAKHYLNKYPGSEVIFDVRTSRATRELIKEWGGKPVRAKAGRVNIGRVLREHQAHFGGETTGHLFFRENYDADSGLIAALCATQAIGEEGKKLSEIIDKYRRYEMAPEINFKVTDKLTALAKLKKAFSDGEQDELDGLTVNYKEYWFNMRVSNTEPVMRLNIEAKTKTQLNDVINKISDLLTGL